MRPLVDISPTFDLDPTIAAFDIRQLTVSTAHTLVALETTANIAIGRAPWGPPFDAHLREGDALPSVDGQLILVGKNNHRHGWVRSLIDEARGIRPDTIVVDMGWPGDDRAYADVATFGASRHVSQALRAWLERTQS